MWPSPDVWGPILIAVVIYLATNRIVQIIHAASTDRRNEHMQVMEVLNCVPDELDNIKIAVNDVARNTERYDEMID